MSRRSSDLGPVIVTASLLSSGCSSTRHESADVAHDLARQVASAYHFNRFYSIEAIRYTLSARADRKWTRRSWIWEPAKDRVTFKGFDPNREKTKLTYGRSELSDASDPTLKEIDHWFINDQYWLLFPYHLIWDQGLQLNYEAGVTSPIKGKNCNRLTVTYPDTDG